MQIYNGTVVLQFDDETTGNAASGAFVTVREYNAVSGSGVLATIYDKAGAQILNPLTTDSQGNYNFKANDGLYDIVIREGSPSEVILPEVALSTAAAVVKTHVPFVADQLIYPLGLSAGSENAVIVNGVVLKSTGVDSQYSVDGSGNLVFASPLTVDFEVWTKPVIGITNAPVTGTRGAPYQFNTLAEFVTNAPSLAVGSWVEILGETKIYDQANAMYQMVNPSSVGGVSDYVIDFGDRKALLMYASPTFFEPSSTPGVSVVAKSPYNYQYPSNELEQQEAANLISTGSLGYGGSTWWNNAPQGRTENGKDVIYVCGTYGTPENRDLEQIVGQDEVLYTNKRLGEAVRYVSRLTFTGAAATEFTQTGINDKLISHREDEHQQPSVLFNNKNGQLIVAGGNRNDARTQDGANVSNINYIRYGQDSNTLGTSESVTYDVTADYAQGFFVGATAYWFQRVDVGNWSFTRGSGGQNYLDPTQFFDSVTEQYYLNFAIVDKSATATDPSLSTERSVVNVFGQAHGTINPDRELRYCKMTFILAGQESAPFDGGGLYATKLDGTTQLGTNTIGRLDGTFVPFVKGDMDLAYTCAVGNSYRLLDVQYGETPRALIAEYLFDWVHGEDVPYGRAYDLKMIEYTGGTWKSLTIASGVRGMLGYEPTANGNNLLGDEGYTSAYVLGGSFYRGETHTETSNTPVIYYCDRVGNSESAYRLNKVTLNAGYTAVSTNVALVSSSDEILYRPEMVLNGKKRILTYNSAQGWSSFNSFVATVKFIDET